MQVQELVGIVPWTFIAQICNLFIQMYLIKRFLSNRSMRCWKNGVRQPMRRSQTQGVRNQPSKRNMSRICRRPRQGQRDSQRQKDSDAAELKIMCEASEQAAALKNKAEKIAQEKKKAVNEVKGEIGGIAMDIAGKVIEREMNEKTMRSR